MMTIFAPGVVTVTLTLNTGSGDNGYRDLDVGGPLASGLTIQGPAEDVAIVASASIGDRVFDILPTGGALVTLTNLTILGRLPPGTRPARAAIRATRAAAASRRRAHAE